MDKAGNQSQDRSEQSSHYDITLGISPEISNRDGDAEELTRNCSAAEMAAGNFSPSIIGFSTNIL